MTTFVGLGAQRAGTTWLWRVLQDHPEVAFGPIKELHYFTVKHGNEDAKQLRTELRKQLIHHLNVDKLNARMQVRIRMLAHRFTMLTDEDYTDYFAMLREYSGKSCVGEITPAYALLPTEGFANLLEVVPEGRFFFILRSPFDRIHSSSRMNGQENRDLLAFSMHPPVRGRTDYRGTVERALSVIPREQLHFAFYEDLCDPERRNDELTALFRHLRLAPHTPAPDVITDRSGARPAPPCDPATTAALVAGRTTPEVT